MLICQSKSYDIDLGDPLSRGY